MSQHDTIANTNRLVPLRTTLKKTTYLSRAVPMRVNELCTIQTTNLYRIRVPGNHVTIDHTQQIPV